MIEPPDPRKGDKKTVEFFRRLLAYLRSLEISSEPGSGVLVTSTPAGITIELEEPQEFPIRITSRTDEKYAWTAVRALAGGTWEDLVGPVGTITRDWAVATPGPAAVTPQVVWARRESHTNRLVFERDNCT